MPRGIPIGDRTSSWISAIADMKSDLRSAYGEAGERWFEALPIRVRRAVGRFGLSDLEFLARGTMSLIFRARAADSSDVILKFAYPTVELRYEIEVLALANGRGYVKLLDVDVDQGVILLECMRIGSDVYRVDEYSDDRSTDLVVECVKSMWRGSGDDRAFFPSVATWSLDFFHASGSNVLVPKGWSAREIESAHLLFGELSAHRAQFVLHGDLHHGNVMRAGHGAVGAIDPKGVAGPLAFEFGAFLRNPFPALLSWHSPAKVISRRASTFGKEFGIDPIEILQWASAQLALSAVWAARDGNATWASYAAALKPEMETALNAAS